MAQSPSNQSSGKQPSGAEQAKQKAGQAKEETKELAGQAKEQALSRAEQQKSRATDSLDHVAKALHQTGDNLREEDQGAVAGYVDDAAGRVESAAGYLRDRSPDELLHEAERFARRDPALFLGGAFVLGLLGARFLKSSSPGSSRRRHTRSRYGGSQRRSDQYYGESPRASRSSRGTTSVYDEPARAGTEGAGTTGTASAARTPAGGASTGASATGASASGASDSSSQERSSSQKDK